jgi:hypothetical protein
MACLRSRGPGRSVLPHPIPDAAARTKREGTLSRSLSPAESCASPIYGFCAVVLSDSVIR